MDRCSWLLASIVLAACSTPAQNLLPPTAPRATEISQVSELPAASEHEIRNRMRLLPSVEPRQIVFDTPVLLVSVRKGVIWVPPYEVDADYRNPSASQMMVTVTDITCKTGGAIDYIQKRHGDKFSLGVECGGVPIASIRNKGRGPTVEMANQWQSLPNVGRLYFRGHEDVEVIPCDNPRSCR